VGINGLSSNYPNFCIANMLLPSTSFEARSLIPTELGLLPLHRKIKPGFSAVCAPIRPISAKLQIEQQKVSFVN